jgi:peptide/nickel transport system substrate-binding protein
MLVSIGKWMCVAIIFLVISSGCAGARSSEVASANQIVFGLGAEPDGFDPHRNASVELGIPLRQIYDTLVYRDPTTRDFVAGLASSWIISPDGLVYRFTLKQGVRFHDGTVFNAASVAATLDRIIAPETASQRAIFLLGTYAGYTVIDDYTIQLQLSAPYAAFLDSLSQVYLAIASPTAIQAVSSERYQFHQVGTGPFRLDEYVPGDRLVIRRNLDYSWGPSFYAPPTAQSIETVEFRFYADASARARALRDGDVQIMADLLPLDAQALGVEQGFRLLPTSIAGQPTQFLINTTQFPTSDLQVRRALIFATNRDVINENLFQRFSPSAWGPLSINTPFFSPALIGTYGYSISEARILLANAGFQDPDNNGFLNAGEGDLTIRILVPPRPLVPQVAEELIEQWRLSGVRVELEQVATRQALFEAVSMGDFNLVAWDESGIDPIFLNQYFSSGGAFNWTGYANPDLDNILLSAASTADITARGAFYAQAQEIIMAQALLLPIRDIVIINGHSERIEGLTYDATGWYPILNNVRLTN